MALVEIRLNGESRTVPDCAAVDDLLDLFSLPRQRIAIELNDRVIRRSEWPETRVSDGDKLEVVHFVGGG